MSSGLEHLNESEIEELRKTFYSQAFEIVEEAQDRLLQLEADPGNKTALKELQRYFHTLKGDSNSIGLTSIGALCHRIEDILGIIKDGVVDAGQEAIGIVLTCVDTISRILGSDNHGSVDLLIREAMESIDTFIREVGPSEEERSSGHDGPFSEYETLQIETAVAAGSGILEIEISLHPLCTDSDIGFFMINRRLGEICQVIRSRPAPRDGGETGPVNFIALVSANSDAETIMEKAVIPGITDRISISPFDHRVVAKDRVDKAAAPDDSASVASEKTAGNKVDNPVTDRRNGDTLRVDVSKVDKIMDLVGELIIGRSIIEQIAKDLSDGAFVQEAAQRLLAANSMMERTVADLQKGTMKMRMVPVNHVFRRFPKMVRDLSSEKGKRVRVDIIGREAELDKGIVDMLSEPIAHILRNMIDHGIEDAEERKAAGKPEEGVITLRAFHESSMIVIEASDDGRGIDAGRLRNKAVEKGLYSASEADKLSDEAALDLVFVSGFSTAETVTNTSGRGVGMDVVKTAVECMKGTIEIETSQGKGTTFRLRLPLTLAIIKALLFEVQGRLYSIPISAICEVTRTMPGDISTIDGKEMLMIRDQIISIVRLDGLFDATDSPSGKQFTIILGVGSRRFGLIVDRLVGQQDLVIKAVDRKYTGRGMISGASILGDGRVVLILDPPSIFNRAIDGEKLRLAGL